MTDRPAFLTAEHVLAIHRRVVADFGGDPAVRDQGLLESAVMMPAAQYGGEFLHPDLPSMAAAYLFHICRSHPFVDGNKRTALVAAEVFLLLNGWSIRATNRELERVTLDIAQGKLTKNEVASFLRSRAAQTG